MLLSRYCGTILSPVGAGAANDPRLTPIISCQKPFRLWHVTGNSGTTGTTDATLNSAPNGVGIANANGDEGATGFVLNYRLLPGNC